MKWNGIEIGDKIRESANILKRATRSGKTITLTKGDDSTETLDLERTRPLAQFTGRWQWSSADDLEVIYVGNSSYGMNYFSHTAEPSNTTFRRYNKANVVDTTTIASAFNAFHHAHYAVFVPDTSTKIRCRATFRVYSQGSLANNSFGFSLWESPLPTSGQTTSNTITLRGTSSVVNVDATSTKVHVADFTTTSTISNKSIIPVVEHRKGSLTSTAYLYGNIQLFMVD